MKTALRLSGSLIFLSLGDGVEAFVDAEDLPLVSPHTWRAYKRQSSKNGERVYVQANIHGRTTYLHRLLMDAPAGLQVDHINHDTLDNRRINLRLVTNQENNTNRDGAYRTSATGVRGVSVHKCRPSGLMYAFRCHCQDCKVAKYFPYTETGLANAKAFAEEHYAAMAERLES